MPVEHQNVDRAVGDWHVVIEFADPWRPSARIHYGGIEIRNGKIMVPFSSKASAELAAGTMIVSVAGEHPVVAGTVLSDPPAIVGNDKGDDHGNSDERQRAV